MRYTKTQVTKAKGYITNGSTYAEAAKKSGLSMAAMKYYMSRKTAKATRARKHTATTANYSGYTSQVSTVLSLPITEALKIQVIRELTTL